MMTIIYYDNFSNEEKKTKKWQVLTSLIKCLVELNEKIVLSVFSLFVGAMYFILLGKCGASVFCVYNVCCMFAMWCKCLLRLICKDSVFRLYHVKPFTWKYRFSNNTSTAGD